MYLSDPIVKLRYESGNEYVASREDTTNKIRLFWEETDDTEYDWQCFSVFDSPDEYEAIISQADSLIVAHKLESEDSLKQTIDMQSP